MFHIQHVHLQHHNAIHILFFLPCHEFKHHSSSPTAIAHNTVFAAALCVVQKLTFVFSWLLGLVYTYTMVWPSPAAYCILIDYIYYLWIIWVCSFLICSIIENAVCQQTINSNFPSSSMCHEYADIFLDTLWNFDTYYMHTMENSKQWNYRWNHVFGDFVRLFHILGMNAYIHICMLV